MELVKSYSDILSLDPSVTLKKKETIPSPLLLTYTPTFIWNRLAGSDR